MSSDTVVRRLLVDWATRGGGLGELVRERLVATGPKAVHCSEYEGDPQADGLMPYEEIGPFGDASCGHTWVPEDAQNAALHPNGKCTSPRGGLA